MNFPGPHVRYEAETQEVSCRFARRADRFTTELRLREEVLLTLPSLAEVVKALFMRVRTTSRHSSRR